MPTAGCCLSAAHSLLCWHAGELENTRVGFAFADPVIRREACMPLQVQVFLWIVLARMQKLKLPFLGGCSNLNSAIDVEENAFVKPSSDRKGQKWIMFRDIHLIALMSQSCRYSSAFNHMFWLATVAPFSHSDDYWEIMTNTRFWKKKKKKHCWLFSCSGLDRGKKPHNLHLVNHGSGITDQVPEVQPLMSVGINKQKIKWTCVRPMYKYQYY